MQNDRFGKDIITPEIINTCSSYNISFILKATLKKKSVSCRPGER